MKFTKIIIAIIFINNLYFLKIQLQSLIKLYLVFMIHLKKPLNGMIYLSFYQTNIQKIFLEMMVVFNL